MTFNSERTLDSGTDVERIAREVLHTANNYLTVCVTHGEYALRSNDPAEWAEALKTILTGAEEVRTKLRRNGNCLVGAAGPPARRRYE